MIMLRYKAIIFICFLVSFSVGCSPAFVKPDPSTGMSAQSSHISTNKRIYAHGEKMQVTFRGSSGHRKDWISLSRLGSPDNEAGEYDYIPEGLTQGVMTFDVPPPGEYEVRAYFNYSRVGYVVSARCKFSVVGISEDAPSHDLGRKVNPDNPIEAQLPPDKGLIYIYNNSSRFLADLKVCVQIDGKTIVSLSPGRYSSYYSPVGTVLFTAGMYIWQGPDGKEEEVKANGAGEATIEVKPGHAYYLCLTAASWYFFLNAVSPEEGASAITSGWFTPVK